MYLLASTLIATQFSATFDTFSSSQLVKSCADCSSSPEDRVIKCDKQLISNSNDFQFKVPQLILSTSTNINTILISVLILQYSKSILEQDNETKNGSRCCIMGIMLHKCMPVKSATTEKCFTLFCDCLYFRKNVVCAVFLNLLNAVYI